MDFDMPGISGPEAARKISKLYEERKITHIPRSSDTVQMIQKTPFESVKSLE